MVTHRRALRDRNPLPQGTVVVGVGLGVTGVASYGYLVISARVMGPAQSGSLSVLWALVFMIGGVFLPFEQEVSRRLVGRRVAGLGSASIVRRSLLLGAALVGALTAVIAAAAPTITDRLFSGQGLLVVGLALGAAGYLVANWTEGVLSGSARFGRYGFYLGGESVLRLAICVGLLAVGVRTAGPVGLALGAAPMAMALPALWGRRDPVAPEPEVAWGDLAGGLGRLLGAAVLAQVLINASPVLLQVLAGPHQAAEVGIFTAALVVARIPLFLFQAIQAVLLPALAALAVAGRFDELRSGVRRMSLLVAALGAAGVIVSAAVGPQLILRVFGAEFPVDRRTVVLLAFASGLYMLANTLAQALIALDRSAQVALGWGAGVVAMIAVVAAGRDPLVTVEVAFVVATGVAAGLMALLLRRAMDRGAEPTTGSALGAMNAITFEA